jgi:hypothetical protein
MRPASATALVFSIFSIFLGACSTTASTDDGSSASDLKAAPDTNPTDVTRFKMLEAMLPDLGRAAAADYVKTTGAPAFGDITDAHCLGPKTADPRYPGVTLGDCDFTFKTTTGGSTTFRAFVSAGIVIPGMPDPEQPNDPQTHEPPPATVTRVTDAAASTAYIVSGDVPALPSPIAMSNKRALAALGHDITARFETSSFAAEGGECGDFGHQPPKFPASEGVKSYCYTYYVDDDRYHGELYLALQTDHHDNAIGIRYFAFGGFD